MRVKLFSLTLLASLSILSYAQAQDRGVGPNFYSTSTSMRVVPPLSSKSQLIPAVDSEKEVLDGRSSKNIVVPGKGSIGPDVHAMNPGRLEGRIPSRMPELVFETAASVSQPTDPAGAVGPNHYVAVFNTGFRIFDKSGNPLTGQLSPDNIFSSGSCCDLTLSYDPNADDDPNDGNPPGRWVMSILYSSNGDVEVAVSQTNDPETTAWNVYEFANINDYQKVSVWSDGYYMTANVNSASAGTNDAVFAMERDAMIAGAPTAQIQAFPLPGIGTFGFYSPQAFNVSDDNMPATGSAPIVYLQDDGWGSVNDPDHVKLWEIDVDWNTPANSTISQPQLLFTQQAFNSVFDGGNFSNLPQPGGGSDIDAIQASIMNQAQFRKFGSHNSAIFNFVVNIGTATADRAGIRWFELRQSGDGQPWSIFQEGTYTSPDGKNAWNASMIMDGLGNIGMGYSGMGGTTSTDVSSYYTGRFVSDAAGTMSVAETLIQAGNASIPSLRYGDYSKIDIDPSDDKKFWFVNELMNNGRKNVAGVFQLAPNTTNDVGVVTIDSPVSSTLTNAETVTVTVFNFGENAASGFDVTYQVDGGTVVTEAFPGTLASQVSAQFTFSTTTDLSVEGQTYSIASSTVLSGDEEPNNDSVTAQVTHLPAVDVGVTAITAPATGSGLSSTEAVTITVENFGGQDQSNIPVSFTLDGGTPVQETLAGPLAVGASTSYTFTATVDLSAIDEYTIAATTSQPGDSDTSNDSTSVVVQNQLDYCIPVTTLGCNIDGIKRFVLNTIDADDGGSGCNSTGATQGYVDRTNLSTDLDRTPGLNVYTLQAQHNWTAGATIEALSVWIDLDDNGIFDATERLIDAVNFTFAGQLNDFTLTIPNTAPIGPHRLRAIALDTSAAGDLTDPCADMAFGETHDYTVNIFDSTLSNRDFDIAGSSLEVLYMEQDQFRIRLNTTFSGDYLNFNLYNLSGQVLSSYRVEPDGQGQFVYDLDMSYAAPGVYIVKMGDDGQVLTRKILVR